MPSTPRLRDSGNLILDRLTASEYDWLVPQLQRTSFGIKQVIHQYEAEVEYVHFPTTALASLLTVLEEDDPIEAATIGREGFLGVTVALGVMTSPNRVICQMSGDTRRLPVGAFREAMDRGPALAGLIRRYAAFMLRYTGQGIACNALHQVEARACRWLLMIHDQAGGDEFPLTQEFLAFMLGARRQGVTVVAGALQNAGMISYRRGVVTVLDRSRLEEAACECYAATRASYDRLMG